MKQELSTIDNTLLTYTWLSTWMDRMLKATLHGPCWTLLNGIRVTQS
ncbi:hypothetical protein LINPERHAP2_LOCUS45231, partial [Linum perenne]